jgi:hypothetical protein
VQVVKTVLPASHKPRAGELIWLFVPPGRAEPAVPAALFE